MNKVKHLAAVAALLLGGTTASAATVSSTGDFLEIAAPASVTNAAPSSNSNIFYFNEVQNYTLSSALTTDTGVLAAGTRVDSHLFFHNRVGGGVNTLSGTLTFATAILGTMSDINGGLLDASDFLGAVGTTYQSGFANRGLESNDSLSFIGDTVTASLVVSQPGDWVRVVTVAAIPVPASILLLPLGLGALGAIRRRRRKPS